MKFLLALGLIANASPVTVYSPLTTPTVQEIIIAEANRQGVDSELAIKIATCESSLNPQAYNTDGGAEARGLWQITRKYHPYITDQEAYSATTSTKWAISQMKEGRYWLWSCYRIINKQTPN